MVKVLILDIETSLCRGYFFSPWNQNITYDKMERDWFVLSWSAKWRGSKEIFYSDQRKRRTLSNDKPLLKPLWKLLNEADVIITKNGKRFDKKKLFARFIINGLGKPRPFKHIDVEQIMRREFGFTYNSLEYATDKLCKEYRKTKSQKYSGIKLWIECEKRNIEAFEEMEKYNKLDVLSTEELYEILLPWYQDINFSHYEKDGKPMCQCGSKDFVKNGFFLAETGARYQRYRCKKCKAPMKSNKKDKLKKAVSEILKFVK